MGKKRKKKKRLKNIFDELNVLNFLNSSNFIDNQNSDLNNSNKSYLAFYKAKQDKSFNHTSNNEISKNMSSTDLVEDNNKKTNSDNLSKKGKVNKKILQLCDSVEELANKSSEIVKNSFRTIKDEFNDSVYDFMQKKLDQRKSNEIVLNSSKENNKCAIQIKNLHMRYTKRSELAIKNCSFNVNYGDFHVFIGQNGAGKSTIIRMIIGLNLDYEGQILIEGIDGKNHISRKNMVFIPDKPIFPTEFSCFDYLLEFAKLHTQNSEELLRATIKKYLEQFEISGIANRNPNKLSSGQKQKVLIIKILLLNSKIIILDEPTSNLDTITRKQFLDILKDLSIKNKVTIFISTHVLEEIKNYANSATFIDKGTILWSGNVQKNDIVEKHNKLFGLE